MSSDYLMKLAKQSRKALDQNKVDTEREALIREFEQLAENDVSRSKGYLNDQSRNKYGIGSNHL